jgi:hypothetical protein
MIATLNAARVLDTADRLLVPYLEGERTPNLPEATGALHGLTTAPLWERVGTRRCEASSTPQVRARFAEARERHLDRLSTGPGGIVGLGG